VSSGRVAESDPDPESPIGVSATACAADEVSSMPLGSNTTRGILLITRATTVASLRDGEPKINRTVTTIDPVVENTSTTSLTVIPARAPTMAVTV